ncbi:MAG: haloacid dehalogenase [Dehalococcoidales bacterium]|jgi:translin|nr:haloacid dehalogenase [Dehalococcoidales bacterium]
MKKLTENLDAFAEKIRADLEKKDAAREKVLPLCRELIRYASITIRAIHRGEFEEARKLLEEARHIQQNIESITAEWDEMRYHGFVRDSQKEYTEASAVLALVTGEPLPDPDVLRVDYTAYLNGLGDTVGELRRYLLDSMRRGDLSRCEEILSAMDDIYTMLVTMDFPDAVTGGLRHTTDNVRGILEKTRGDVTLAVTQKQLEQKISEHMTGNRT